MADQPQMTGTARGKAVDVKMYVNESMLST